MRSYQNSVSHLHSSNGLIAIYLKDRTQVTKIGHTLSTPRDVVSGVPQGSVLGPMFFCLVVGDLRTVHNDTQIIQYIDDTSLCIPLFKGAMNCHVIHEHSNILKWANTNGFVVNTKKCQSLFVRKSCESSDIELKDAPTVNKIKFLGIYLNSKLTFSTHIRHVCQLSARRFYALRILKPLMDRDSLVSVYHGSVRSILEYGSPAFGKLPTNLEKMLVKIQNRCHRLICSVPHSSECPCTRFPLLSTRRSHIAARLLLSAVANGNHILHGIVPARSNRSSRLIQPQCRTARFRNSFVPYTTILVNGTSDCWKFPYPLPPPRYPCSFCLRTLYASTLYKWFPFVQNINITYLLTYLLT